MSKEGGDFSMRVVMGWVIGLSGIALMLLIMLILFGNLQGNVGFTNDALTFTVTNESGFANATGYTLTNVNSSNSAYTLTALWNFTIPASNVSLLLPNATVSAAGVVINGSTVTYPDLSISYTFSNAFPSQGLADTNNFIGNYTTSVLNTGSQFPVVGTIIGVALLLFILISLLIFALVKMGKVGGSGGRFG